jgi:hypothetical protein
MISPALSHYLMSFTITTLGVVAFLYLVYVLLRKNPRLGAWRPPSNPASSAQMGLRVESRLDLEARKRLYVVGYGSQRFLLATSLDKTELLATLQPETTTSCPEKAALPHDTPQTRNSLVMPLQPMNWRERLGYSIRMLMTQRFASLDKR